MESIRRLLKLKSRRLIKKQLLSGTLIKIPITRKKLFKGFEKYQKLMKTCLTLKRERFMTLMAFRGPKLKSSTTLTSNRQMISFLDSLTTTSSTMTHSSAASLAIETVKKGRPEIWEVWEVWEEVWVAWVAWEASIASGVLEDLCSTTMISFPVWDVEEEEEVSQASQVLRLVEEAVECQVRQSQSAQPQKQCSYFLIQQRKDSNDKKDDNNPWRWHKRCI